MKTDNSLDNSFWNIKVDTRFPTTTDLHRPIAASTKLVYLS